MVLSLPFILFIGITIGFLKTRYTVSEGVGNAALMVGVISGDHLETNIVVNISTADDAAVCKFIILVPAMINYHHIET